MRKTLIIILSLIMLIVGISISEKCKSIINYIKGEEIFKTLESMEKKLAKEQKEKEKLQKKLEEKSLNINNLSQELDSLDIEKVIKEELLGLSKKEESNKEKSIVVNQKGSESFTTPIQTGDKDLKKLLKVYNNKMGSIMKTSKELLGNTVNKMDNEVRQLNSQLKLKNLNLMATIDELSSYKEELARQRKYTKELENIQEQMSKNINNLETKIENGKLKVNFKGDILFDSGKHKLKKEGKKLIDSISNILKKSSENNEIFIAGHTDNQKVRKNNSKKYTNNWELSNLRALEVVKYLSKKGINPKTMTAAGYGEYRPLFKNNTAANREKNRRVELFLTPKFIKRAKN